MGFIKKIGMIISFITLIILLSYIVTNLSLNTIISKKTISKGLKDVSFTELIYSDTLDNNAKVVKFRSNLDKVYKIVSVFNLPKESVDKILDESVKSDITSSMVDNVIYTIKTGEDIPLISEEEFNIIINDFIEGILVKLNVNGIERELIKAKLVDICKNLNKYVPSTELVISKVSTNKINIIRFLINNNMLILSTVLSLICILLLYIFNDKIYYIFKDISLALLFECVLITLFIIIAYICANTNLKFIQSIISVYVDIIFGYLWLLLIIGSILMLIYIIVNKKKKLVID